jgi:hypothetical protein
MYLLSIDVGLKNLSFCWLAVTKDCVKILDWQNICVTSQNYKKATIETVMEELLDTLTDTFAKNKDFYADMVLIENQPKKNGMMKNVSIAIYTYFNMMRAMHGSVHKVMFFSPKNKLKCSKASSVPKKPYNPRFKSTYKDRKKLGIDITRLYLEEIDPDRLHWFDKLKKQDDYGDCFCQAMYFVESKKNSLKV